MPGKHQRKKKWSKGTNLQYKMNNFWKSHVQHGDCSNNVILYT